MHSEGFPSSPVKKILLACVPPAIIIAAALLSPLPHSQAENITQNQQGQTAAISAAVSRHAAALSQDIVEVDNPAQERALAVRELWFDQTSYGDAKYQGEYTIAKYGGGACSTAAALDIVFEQTWSPREVAENMSRWAQDNGNIKYCIEKGTVYSAWEKVVEGAYGVRIEPLSGVEDVYRELAAGNPVIACGEGDVFKAANGSKYSHDGRIICFYRTDGDNAWAKDSDHEKGGGDIAYSAEELRAFASSAKGKMFSLTK